MFKEFVKILKELPMAEKWLIGVSLLLLINYQFAILLAVITLMVYIARIGKQMKAYSEKENSGITP